MGILHEPQTQSTPGVNSPTQFALTSIDRIVFLIERYEGLRVDAETLPPDPTRPPISYITHTLAELRRELTARESEAVAA
ncbi:MAG: hypothetical protein M3Q71_13130 [Chloroflexota bacterium]|nr:hypothetical protein [Chloroflexota bacterium]